jgi:hypothetical protein
MKNIKTNENGVIVDAENVTLDDVVGVKMHFSVRDAAVKAATAHDWAVFLFAGSDYLRGVVDRINAVSFSTSTVQTMPAKLLAEVLTALRHPCKVTVSEGHNDPGYGTFDLVEGDGFYVSRRNSKKWGVKSV